eukprot:GFKZ01001894.1.p1 GENE.GFKZ01001894.1~~GFKZ01001894.1.p1  ORF type:complete len:369 (+),score=57.92 GFKZ01001894.1:346-1452(+)
MAFLSPTTFTLRLPPPSQYLNKRQPTHHLRRPATSPPLSPLFSASPRASAVNETDASPSTPAPNSERPSLAPPPSTFFQAITQAQQAVDSALAAGFTLLEVEFPPLSTSELENSAVGAYDVFDANVRLAVDFSRKYAEAGKRVAIAFPDLIEKDRAVEQNNEMEEPVENVRFSSLRDAKKGAWIERLWVKPEIDTAVRDDDDMFLVLGASCQELPDVERLVERVGGRPVLLFNLKLDTARGDLGLPAFPRRDLHFRFLSKVLPVYYLRTRTYSRSIARRPFVVNYSGALYRVYPGAWQVLLDTERGNYKRLATLDERPSLGGVRDILTDGLNLEGVQGKQASVLSKGYKTTTWWEEDREKAQSNLWRS